MEKKLTFEQLDFLERVLFLTDIDASYTAKRVYFSTSLCGNGIRIDLVCERIIKAGLYDPKNYKDMEKLNYIREWYIETQLNK